MLGAARDKSRFPELVAKHIWGGKLERPRVDIYLGGNQVICWRATKLGKGQTAVSNLATLGTGFKRFPGSLDGVVKQGETYLTDTLPQRYSLTNPNLASTIPLTLFDMPPDPLYRAS